MKTPLIPLWFLGLGVFAGSALQTQGQATFRANLSARASEVSFLFGGVGYFRIGPQTGEFETAIVQPFTGTFTPTIVTPSGSLTFSLGPGQPRTYSGCDPFEHHPFLPPPPPPNPWDYTCPAFTTGTHYKGTFPSSPELFAELLAGNGVFQLRNESEQLLSGEIVLSVRPVLTIVRSDESVILSWDTVGFQVEQTTSLALNSWTAVPNGNVSPVILPLEGGGRFFRLAR